jgi:hypothetical protein
MNATSPVGTVEWTRRTGGRLEPAERRRLVGDLARVHVRNVIGRFTSTRDAVPTFRPPGCCHRTRG